MIKNKKKESEKDNKQALKETLLQEDSPELSLAEKLREKKLLQKKKNKKKLFWLIFTPSFIAFLYWGFMPFQGPVPYALCKIVIELNIPYPTTLQFTEVSFLRTGSIRIWFTHTDAFGAFRQEPFVCTFGEDPDTKKTILMNAKWANLDLSQKQIESFNKVIPYIIAGQYYDTSYPPLIPNSLEDITFNVDKYRKVNIMDLITKKR